MTTKKNKNDRSPGFRGYSQRKFNTKEVKQRFLIVCEGEKTEPNYFKCFRVPKVVLDVKGVGENPLRLVSSAEDYSKLDKYDQVWCVFDRDDSEKQDFSNAIYSAESKGFKVAYSNEAFELWYVLHFEFLCTGIPRKDYIKKLDKLLRRKYQKNSESIYDDLIERQSIAIENAKNLLAQYEPHKPVDDNPSTTVHCLVEALNKFIS